MRTKLRISTAVLCGVALLTAASQETAAATKYAATTGAYLSGGYTSQISNTANTGNLYNGNPGIFTSRIGDTGTPGETIGTLPGPTFRTFCVDIGTNNVSGMVDLADVSVTDGTFNDASTRPRDIGAAGYIVNTFWTYQGEGPNASAWNSLYASAGLSAAQLALVDLNMQIAVTQTMVWAKAYGTVSNSSVKNSNAGVQTVAQKLYDAMDTMSAGKSALTGFINYPPPGGLGTGEFQNQDMLYAVPEPSSLAVAGLGALGFLGYGLRRRKMMRA